MNKGDPGYVQAVIDQRKYNLTFAQQEFIQKNCDSMTLVDLMKKTFKEDSLNERSVEYDEVRKYTAKVKRKVPSIEFSEEQLNFIEANGVNMKALELAKTLFPEKNILPLSSETQTISEYLKALGVLNSNGQEEDGYKPPKAAASLVRKINQADSNADFNANDLNSFQRKCVDSLRSYLQSIRFIAFMRMFEEPDMKEMMEEEFIKGVYDKPDLNSEELNMYINLCIEYVAIHQITKSKTLLEVKINNTLIGGDEKDGDGEGKKLYMTWVDLLSAREADLHKAKKRAEDLQVNLSSSRSKRLSSIAQINESLSKFVEEWKTEEGRARALKIAEAQKMVVENEIKRIETFDEYIANVFGIGKDEILKN